jgi:hypothetical protein
MWIPIVPKSSDRCPIWNHSLLYLFITLQFAVKHGNSRGNQAQSVYTKIDRLIRDIPASHQYVSRSHAELVTYLEAAFSI